MPHRPYEFVTDCISADGDDIHAMREDSKDITWETFIKHVPVSDVRRMFDWYDFTSRGPGLKHIKHDWSVSFSKGTYQGKPCYFITQSGIEYVWIEVKED